LTVQKLAKPALNLYALVLILWGISGMAYASGWLQWLIAMPPIDDAVARAILGSEFRFLHARELGVGLLTWACQSEILTSPRLSRAFLVVVWLAPVARLVALTADGRPNLLWNLFAWREVAMATVLTAALRRPLAVPEPSA